MLCDLEHTTLLPHSLYPLSIYPLRDAVSLIILQSTSWSRRPENVSDLMYPERTCRPQCHIRAWLTDQFRVFLTHARQNKIPADS